MRIGLEGSGWSLKALHREILLTAAYAQGSDPGPKSKALESDPENAWLSHASRRRLEVEAWRDAMLAVTGELDPYSAADLLVESPRTGGTT